MNPGSVFLDEAFQFHDGENGEKFFLVLGTVGKISVVVKTTSQQHGRGTIFGCQPNDRFHNFFIPPKVCWFHKPTWLCLDEFYELNPIAMLKKKYDGKIKPACEIVPNLLRLMQDCALISLDISEAQSGVIKSCLF